MKEIPDIYECALETCSNLFHKQVHNQRFCSRECCKIYTNKRILAQYHAKKNKKNTERRCAHRECITILSRYNEDVYCGSHQQERHISKLQDWGFNVDQDNY